MTEELKKHFESRIKRLTINKNIPNHMLVNMIRVYTNVVKYNYL